ncbi:class I SAM-dependent methyltransferase [Candidatus Nitrosacidococcus sp. I8]|uniref:class I SAM-dependent methyltransferase n=1 Tax=Candidatus Nitrosacidococcus sp. I8 TaxID=2942908 RepID=UPI002225BAF6|nr:methyltransferase domain-containing protein [Candidatus Nitrosacidococcus sp. I8]CAH9014889.1 Ubiquinone biosynthesis O-methyltransferase, mitochondrial [Candidatus Nitrosacidococcus sp. I8]
MNEELHISPDTERDSNHVYTRDFDPKANNSLAKIARLIKPNSQILDLGTGPGVLGKYLAQDLKCTVDGVEKDEVQAKIAAPFYRQLCQTDLEQANLSALFQEKYDYIICADVLEHLRNPELIVSQFADLLASNGKILLSIPNIAHAGVIASLLAGDFFYGPEGLLDTTHVRFFTRKSLFAFLTHHHLAICSMDTVLCDLRDSEFRQYYVDTLPPQIFNLLKAYPDSLTYQFIVEATIGQEETNLLAENNRSNQFHFATQIYWRFDEEPYQEYNSNYSLGVIGAERQTIFLPIPPMNNPPSGIRVDLADRPGFLQLYEIILYNQINNIVYWQKGSAQLQFNVIHQVYFIDKINNFDANTLLTGEDPYFELPLDKDSLKSLQNGGCLELKLSWPMSADFLALSQHIKQRDRNIIEQDKLIEWYREQANIQDRIIELKESEKQAKEQQNNEKDLQINLLSQQNNEKDSRIVCLLDEIAQYAPLSDQIQSLNHQISDQNKVLQSLEFQLTYQNSWLGWLRRPFRPLKQRYLKIINLFKF